jgi:hypothetical protein
MACGWVLCSKLEVSRGGGDAVVGSHGGGLLHVVGVPGRCKAHILCSILFRCGKVFVWWLSCCVGLGDLFFFFYLYKENGCAVVYSLHGCVGLFRFSNYVWKGGESGRASHTISFTLYALIVLVNECDVTAR